MTGIEKLICELKKTHCPGDFGMVNWNYLKSDHSCEYGDGCAYGDGDNHKCKECWDKSLMMTYKEGDE